MSIRLHLLCAASTSATRAVSFPANEPVDELGRKALSALADTLPPFEKIWASPALCAVQTGEALKLCANNDALLRDCDFGRWAGRTFSAVQAAEPDALAAWLSDPAAAPHGGESFAAVMARAKTFLDRMLSASGSTLAITHPTIIRACIACALDAGAHAMGHIDISPLSRATLSGASGRWTFKALLPHQAR